MLTIVEQKAWTNGAATIAAHCVPPAGFTLTVQGYRVCRDGVRLFPCQKPFPTREAAQAWIDAQAVEAEG